MSTGVSGVPVVVLLLAGVAVGVLGFVLAEIFAVGLLGVAVVCDAF